MRFCSNQQWGEELGGGGGGDYSVSNVKSRRSKSWDYVADHVKLGEGGYIKYTVANFQLINRGAFYMR